MDLVHRLHRFPALSLPFFAKKGNKEKRAIYSHAIVEPLHDMLNAVLHGAHGLVLIVAVVVEVVVLGGRRKEEEAYQGLCAWVAGRGSGPEKKEATRCADGLTASHIKIHPA